MGRVNDPVNRFIHPIFFQAGSQDSRFGLETWSPQLSYKPMSYGTAQLKTRLKLGLGIQLKKRGEEGEAGRTETW